MKYFIAVLFISLACFGQDNIDASKVKIKYIRDADIVDRSVFFVNSHNYVITDEDRDTLTIYLDSLRVYNHQNSVKFRKKIMDIYQREPAWTTQIIFDRFPKDSPNNINGISLFTIIFRDLIKQRKIDLYVTNDIIHAFLALRMYKNRAPDEYYDVIFNNIFSRDIDFYVSEINIKKTK